MSKAEHIEKLYKKVVEGEVSDLSDADLHIVTAHTGNINYLNAVKYEIERRTSQRILKEMQESTRMQKWVAIATVMMALATFLLVIITWTSAG